MPRRCSIELIVEDLKKEATDDSGGDKGLKRFSGLVRPCSTENLDCPGLPGAWECPQCSFMNEASIKMCRICTEPRDESDDSSTDDNGDKPKRDSNCSKVISVSDFMTSKDDMMLHSWTQLGSVIDSTVALSVPDTDAPKKGSVRRFCSTEW